MFDVLTGRESMDSGSRVVCPPVSNRKLRLWVATLISLSTRAYMRAENFIAWSQGEPGDQTHPLPVARAWCNTEYREGDPDFTTRASLLREIVGNPFRPVINPMPPHADIHSDLWGLAYGLAMEAYEGDWSALLPLSDALEEAGCYGGPLLNHLRSKCPACTDKTGFVWGVVAGCRTCSGVLPTLHVRGCWALDLLLGKK